MIPIGGPNTEPPVGIGSGGSGDARVHFGPVGPRWIPDGDVAGTIELLAEGSFERALPPGGYVVSVIEGARVVERVVEVPSGGSCEIVVDVESDE